MALVKQYSSSNMETVTKHSTASNTKLIQNEYWNIISVKKTFNISHKILGIHKSYNQSSKRCLLCLNEKLEIALHKFSQNTRKYVPENLHRVAITNVNFFVLIVSYLRTQQWKKLQWTTKVKVFNTMVSHECNMTSFSPCFHKWLASICFCAWVCLLPRIFCLACYRLCIEQFLAFHWDIGNIV